MEISEPTAERGLGRDDLALVIQPAAQLREHTSGSVGAWRGDSPGYPTGPQRARTRRWSGRSAATHRARAEHLAGVVLGPLRGQVSK
jgi:hypothetical protein